ncbi:MAG: aspartate carbamoyltransferase regulatory subunit [Candidatus Micrarchaeia archaeon]
MSTKDAEGLSVRKIRDGVVIDHIEPGMALNVLKMLHIDGSPEDSSMVSALMHAPSSRMGHKDIVKIEGRKLNEEEIDVISLISPRATINDIYKYKVVKKRSVALPESIKGSIACSNPSCITNQNEPIKSEFYIISQKPVAIRCKYCGRDMSYEDISAYVKNR